MRSRFTAGLLVTTALELCSIMPANGGVIRLRDLLSGGACIIAPDPGTSGAEFGAPAGCWNLRNRNSDNTIGGAANGSGIVGMDDATVTGSDANGFDLFGGISGPMVDSFGTPLSTLTEFTTVISETTPGMTLGNDGVTLSGELTFNWSFTTVDAGSFYDPAGYIRCPAAPTGYPGEICGLYQLTGDIDALNPPYSPNPIPPFTEVGSVTLTLAPGDVFGGYVLTADNAGGAGTIVFSDSVAPVPEPASFLLIGVGLLVLSRFAGMRAGSGVVGKE